MGRSGATLQCTRIALLRAGLTGADDYEEEEAEEDRADRVLGLFPGAGGPDVFTEQLMSSIQREDKKYGIRRKVSVPLHLATKSFLRNDHVILVISLNI